MGRILFLSTVAFLAYRYISRSNQRHQSLPSGEKNGVEILPPAPTTVSLNPAATSGVFSSASETVPHARLITTTSRAAESDPVR